MSLNIKGEEAAYNRTDIVWTWVILNVTVVPDVAICVGGRRVKWGVRSPSCVG